MNGHQNFHFGETIIEDRFYFRVERETKNIAPEGFFKKLLTQ